MTTDTQPQSQWFCHCDDVSQSETAFAHPLSDAFSCGGIVNVSFISGHTGSDVVSFDGQGVISYRFSSKTKKIKFLTDLISLKFRTSAGHGVLLHGEGQQGDYISLELQRARLVLSINLGKGVSEGVCRTIDERTKKDGLHIELSHTSESRLISYLLISITMCD